MGESEHELENLNLGVDEDEISIQLNGGMRNDVVGSSKGGHTKALVERNFGGNSGAPTLKEGLDIVMVAAKEESPLRDFNEIMFSFQKEGRLIRSERQMPVFCDYQTLGSQISSLFAQHHTHNHLIQIARVMALGHRIWVASNPTATRGKKKTNNHGVILAWARHGDLHKMGEALVVDKHGTSMGGDDSFVVKLGQSFGYDILRCEVEIVEWLIRCELESNIRTDVVYGHDILRCEVEIVDGPFVVKLSLELDIIRHEVEIQSKDVADGHDIIRREVEIVDGPFIVKLSLELDIIRRKVEIQSKD
ncbi:hypothetical protein F3Y22_tig00110503pilonHSYRG00009 [Hibiscus syriacus]|uniref:Uncharacterized protein n=1 Tax=Hibiscus syriacus TaxID=106335 RepID=A0A6A3AGK2_HIBSY|nr:hypothetical protein F3Y22_tig00110503pilonHSYRG00009 [Hibiscus syriacus]